VKIKKATKNMMIPIERIEKAIFLIRGMKVMIDADLASLYGVPTKVLNQAVTRNVKRFPLDFMFRLTKMEKDGNFYTGFTQDLKLRFEQHDKGQVESTRDRRPLELIYLRRGSGSL